MVLRGLSRLRVRHQNAHPYPWGLLGSFIREFGRPANRVEDNLRSSTGPESSLGLRPVNSVGNRQGMATRPASTSASKIRKSDMDQSKSSPKFPAINFTIPPGGPRKTPARGEYNAGYALRRSLKILVAKPHVSMRIGPFLDSYRTIASQSGDQMPKNNVLKLRLDRYLSDC